jgi:predicted acyltransferase
MNAIAAFALSEATSSWLDQVQATAGMNWQEFIYQRGFAPLASPANASLLYALAYVLVCWVAMWVLYRRGIFLKV